MPLNPPQKEGSIGGAHTATIRYTCTGLVNVSITRQQLWNTLVTATGTTVGYGSCSAVKVRRIRIWAPPPGNAAATTATLSWFSSWSPAKVIVDTGMGSTRGARIESRPPARSLAGEWSMTGSNQTEVVFAIICPSGSVVDVDYSFRLQDTLFGAPLGAAVTLVGATVGTMYVSYLDFIAQGTMAVMTPTGENYIL